ncbi:MAG TPA: hypothetical protein VGG74_29005 [Kofleriaceae bacterium]|jgi:hypothetical protein
MASSQVFLDKFQRRMIRDESLAEGASLEVGQLTLQVRQLRQTINELTATVAVLADALAERGGIDPVAFETRINAVLDAQRAVGPTEKCVKCGRTVPARLTNVTFEGAVCDVCQATES